MAEDGLFGIAFHRPQHDINAVLLQQVFGAGSHPAGNNYPGTLLGQPYRQKPELVLRRRNIFPVCNFSLLLIDIKESKLLTMSKVRRHSAADYRYRVFHCIPPAILFHINP